MDDTEILIRKLIERRKALGITQTRLAEMTGLKQSNIARLERGTQSPNLDTVIKVASALSGVIDFTPNN